MKELKKSIKRGVASALLLMLLALGDTGISAQASRYKETTHTPDEVLTCSTFKTSRPPHSLDRTGFSNVSGKTAVTSSASKIGVGQTGSSLTLKVAFSFDRAANTVEITNCEVSIDNQDPDIFFQVGDVSTFIGNDWYSNAAVVKKSCSATANNKYGQSLTLGPVWIQVYADGGYQIS